MSQQIVGWRAWYFDGELRRFQGGTSAEFKALPAEGAQGFVEYEAQTTPDGNHCRGIIAGSDWYWWASGHIQEMYSADERGTWLQPPEASCSGCLKRSGEWLPDDVWATIQREMTEAAKCPR